MAAIADGSPPDPLLLLRRTIASGSSPIPTTDPDPSSQAQSDVTLAEASHLIFNFDSPQDGAQHIAVPLNQATRFLSRGKPLELRSVYFCWLSKDKGTAEYLTAVQTLNADLKTAGKSDTAVNIPFAEKLDLVTWLNGDVGEHESEYISSLDNNKSIRTEAADAAKVLAGDTDVEMRDVLSDEAKRREEEERLRGIYAAERKMGDHNTVLRGFKAQDFSGVRKYSALFLGKAKPTAQQAQSNTTTLTENPALRPPIKPSQSGRRPEQPIILLSSSFSSLIRMPNIKSFLGEGIYAPLESSGDAPNILHITRNLRTISPGHSTRFILVDDPSGFRPDYWNRVVAVFTTGQVWQFKNYKWQNPAELFSHTLGVYVGWKGEVIPDTVKGWGRGVLSVQIDKGQNRWRDREVVEDIWSQVETRMRAMGWGKDGR